MASRCGYSLRIDEYALMQMARPEIEQWIRPAPPGSAWGRFEPGRRFRCEICMAAWPEHFERPWMSRMFDRGGYFFRFECDPRAHEAFYGQFSELR